MDSNNSEIVVQIVSLEEYHTRIKELEGSTAEAISFLQSPLYGSLQTSAGSKIICFIAHSNDSLVACGLGVRYEAPFGLNFLYFPYGPVALSWSGELLKAIEGAILPEAKKLNCAFIRFDNLKHLDNIELRPVANRIARTASLQPRAEWLLDITPTADDIFMGMHKHARYNVRLAERADADIKIYLPNEAPLDTFYELMQTTGSRDSFGIFDKTYYESYLKSMKMEDGFMVICSIDNKPAAAGLFVTYDKQAHYVFAGSSNDFRKIAPAYSVIWSAIKEAKQRSCTLFNFGGIVDEVKGQDLAGVTGFKKRFGGYSNTYDNPVDIPVSNLRYNLFKLLKLVKP